MTPSDELLPLVDRILKLVREDESALEHWRQTEDGQKVIQYVVQIGKYPTNVGQGKDISIGDRLDRSLLEEIRDLLKSQLSLSQLDIDWQQVSRSLLNEQIQRLTTNPLTHAEGIAYRTEQVYVPLGLVERKKVSRRKEDVSPEQGSLLYEETEITQKFEHEAFLEQVLRQRRSPQSGGRRIAVIGEPGAGKTTLLQQMARWVAENIEGAIAIWVSLADLQGRSLEDYLLGQWLPALVQQQGRAEASTPVKDALVAQFRAGRVWLLLDGVDEMSVSSGNPLSEMDRQVRLGGLLAQARIVLTCRLNLWDGDRHALDRFDVYRTLEFAYPGQVEQFVGQWFGALPEAQVGQAERLCEALRQPGKERLRDLVKNPLRLTLLCFNWYLGEGTLPETKAGLYEQFVADFYEWKRERFPTTAAQRERLNAVLGELAREAIDKEETRFRLRHDFVCEFLGEPDEPDSLFQMALRLGWLNQVGVDAANRRKAVYAFFHPTFQEYFAALSINDWHFFFNHIPKHPSHFAASYQVFESHWKEVFLLWLGRKDRLLNSQKEALIKALMTFKDKCKGFYSDQAFLLAALGLAEFKDCSYADAIINQLVQWIIGNSNWLKRDWMNLFVDVRGEARAYWAASAFSRTDSQQMLQILVQILETTQDKNIRWRVAKSLGEIDVGNEIAIQALVRVLENTQDKGGSLLSAIESLGKIGTDNEMAIRVLAWLLENTQDELTLFETSESLGKINPGNTAAIQALLKLLETTQNEHTCFITARILAKIDPGNEMAIQALVKLLETTQDEDLRWRAADNLGEISIDNETAIQALVRLIETTQDEDTYLIATENLGKIGVGNEMATHTLIQVLESTQNSYIYWRTASSLGEIGIGNNEAATRKLLWILETTDSSYIGWRTANSLTEIDDDKETIIHALIQALKITQCKYKRTSVIQSLIKVGTRNERTTKLLVRSLRRHLREEKAYQLMIKCAETLSYPKFFQAFHSRR